MHQIKRAVIMAAGRGERMRPLTLTTPKPLISVGGVRMIDTAIRGLRDNGILEIYVVVGYLKEKFLPLEREYPGLRLIENPWYDSCNNISSLYAARDHLEEAMIMDGDQIVRNAKILRPGFSRSGYHCVWTEKETKEWLLTEENGAVTGCSRNGGNSGWQLYSVSRWTAEDGRKLKYFLERDFPKPENQALYWDDIPLFLHPEGFSLRIYPMDPRDVLEIDSLEELRRAEEPHPTKERDEA